MTGSEIQSTSASNTEHLLNNVLKQNVHFLRKKQGILQKKSAVI